MSIKQYNLIVLNGGFISSSVLITTKLSTFIFPALDASTNVSLQLSSDNIVWATIPGVSIVNPATVAVPITTLISNPLNDIRGLYLRLALTVTQTADRTIPLFGYQEYPLT